MPARNSAHSYGGLSRSLHWATAVLIFVTFPIGLIANRLPLDTPEAVALKTQAFSLHKTLGVAVFTIALIRIIWALMQPKPAPLHPERRAETLVAEIVHWALYLSLVVVPLSGWVQHAALDGFAPILWSFGQDLPFVPKSETVARMAEATHWLFTKIFAASILLHIAGALKHAVIDRDLTLARMTKGTAAGPATAPRHSPVPLALALAIFGAGGFSAWQLGSADEAPATLAAPAGPTAGNWQVTEGSLDFTVQQSGAAVSGSFPTWTAEISFDETTGTGTVSVRIDMASLTLGAVTDQAKGAEFFDAASHPSTSFVADIAPGGDGHIATGTLTLRGAAKPVALPFTLTISGDTAEMTGTATLDRRDFAIGPSYPDEKTVGFTVIVSVALKATRAKQ